MFVTSVRFVCIVTVPVEARPAVGTALPAAGSLTLCVAGAAGRRPQHLGAHRHTAQGESRTHTRTHARTHAHTPGATPPPAAWTRAGLRHFIYGTNHTYVTD